jgi:hypothetical protein
MKKILLKLFFPSVLILISVFLCFKNYSPGTYLIGWDSLHPEFNFSLNASRMLSHVWGGEMGVGAVSAHSDVSDLPRILVLWLTSVLVSTPFIRYFYIFACLILGPLGVYFFLKYVFQKESIWTYSAAFLGAFFYLLNLGTLQNFYVPLEMFTTAFAFIPWIAYTGLKFLREGGKANLIFWVMVMILSSPMAYAATLWYASFAGLFIFFAAYSLISSGRIINIKRFLVLVLTSVFLNLYWILPNIYSVVNQSGVISNSNINRLFSQEAFLRNRDYGDFADILLQKNFLFSWRNFDAAGNQFTDLLGVWQKYLASSSVLVVGYILAGFSFFGLVFGAIKRSRAALAFIPSLVFCLFFLVNINPPIGGLYSYLYNNFGIFAEGFRMPFTKFSILYELIVSFYFGYFAFVLFGIRGKLFVYLKLVALWILIAGLCFIMKPAFEGNLIGQNIRKALPPEYQQMFSWFSSNSYGRVALFPINSKYGWEYRNWGYEGSGFLTYGIANPVLYRDFDRWSTGNEDFYTQSAFALYSNDNQAFVNTLKKYQVKYLLLDESIINPGGTPDILKIPELKKIISEAGIRETAKFGFLTIYETGYGQAEVTTPFKFVQTDSSLSYSPVDHIYAENGDYISSGNTTPIRKNPVLPSGSPAVSEDFSINRGFPDAYNCDLKKMGSVFKANSGSGILYRAEGGGASCDYLPYLNLKYNQAFVLRVAGENREGRSLKIYLFNLYSQVPDVEEILPSGKFDKTYFVYPKNIEGAGYVLNLETRSFGRIPSENLLTKVDFYPVEFNGIGRPAPIANSLVINKVQKFGTWGYGVETGGIGLLELGQGFENGWIGFTIQDSRFKILNHVKVNSWANGWNIENPTTSVPNSIIYILFWPQLLEWGGGVLGLVAILCIL